MYDTVRPISLSQEVSPIHSQSLFKATASFDILYPKSFSLSQDRSKARLTNKSHARLFSLSQDMSPSHSQVKSTSPSKARSTNKFHVYWI